MLQTKTLVRRTSKALAKNVLTYRAAYGLDVTALSRQTGVSRRTIDRIEAGSGIPYNPSIVTVQKLANFFGMTSTEITAW